MAGTVDATVWFLWNRPMKDPCAAAWAAGAIANAANATAPAATVGIRAMRWIDGMSQPSLSSGPLPAHTARAGGRDDGLRR